MPVAVTCSSCTTRLQIPDNGLGKRVKCPKCANVFVAEDDDAPVEAELDNEIAEKPITVAKRRRAVDELPVPTGKRRAEQPDEEEAVELVEEVAEDEEERPRKKKRKKKRRRFRVAESKDEYEAPAWPWWVFGGGGVAAVMLFFLVLAVIAESPFVKFSAISMLIMMPISMVIFFMAMILSSVLVGAMEIGELHVAFVKAFAVCFIVNLVSLFPCVGIWITIFVWVIAVVVVFRLDFWEARVLVFFNWLLNFAAWWVLIYALTMIGNAGSMDDDDGFAPPPRNRPGINAPGPGQGPAFGDPNDDEDD